MTGSDVSTILLPGWLGLAGLMIVLWMVQRRTRDAGIVDVGWAAGLGLLAIWFALASDGLAWRRGLVGVLAAAWSFRLTVFLARRIAGRPEDGRYRTLRARHAAHLQTFFFVFFQAQALLAIVLAVPFLVAMRNPKPGLTALDVLAVALWLVSAGGEALADWQLNRFRADPANRGRTCRAGLWRYSRHPNYFFQSLFWWTFVLLSVGAPLWWLTFISPLLILLLVLKVTGIPPTEAQALASRGDDYRAYQRSTSAFVPWFPKGGDA